METSVFLLKKIFGQLLMPMPISLVLIVLGLIFTFSTNRQKIGRILILIGACILVFMSYGFVPRNMAQLLEGRNAPVLESNFSSNQKYIVVLGSGHRSNPKMPENSQLDSSSISRLVEAIRLHRFQPNTKIIFSGWGGVDPVPHAEVMAKAAVDLGVSTESVIAVSKPRDTKDEARIISEIVRVGLFCWSRRRFTCRAH